MKKILIILLLLACTFLCYAESESDIIQNLISIIEENNEIIEVQKSKINELANSIKSLEDSNSALSEELINSKASIKELVSLNEELNEAIKNSNKIINRLNNQKLLFGGGFEAKYKFKDGLSTGYYINAGYKVFIGYVTIGITKFKSNEFSLNFGYNVTI